MTFHSIAKTKKLADKRPWAFLCYLRRYFFVIQVLDGVFNAYMVCVLLFYGRIFTAYLPTVFYFQCAHTPDVGLQLRAAVWVRTVGAQKAHKKRTKSVRKVGEKWQQEKGVVAAIIRGGAVGSRVLEKGGAKMQVKGQKRRILLLSV